MSNSKIVDKPFPPDWLRRFDYETLERLAIMMVDGGMSDDEALEIMGLRKGEAR
jgi:hypothetical protein